MGKENNEGMPYLIDEEKRANQEAAEGLVPEAGALTVGCLILSLLNPDFIDIATLSSVGFVILCREADL